MVTREETDAPAGPVLGEEARSALSDALVQGVPGLYSEWDDGEDVGKVLAAIAPVVAALVSQARAEGAAEERERLHAEIHGSALVIAALVSRLGGSVVLTADEMRSTKERLRLTSAGGGDSERVFRVVPWRAS